MTNPGPSICPKCGATMETSAAGGMKYRHCPACKYTVGSLDRRGFDPDLGRAMDAAGDWWSNYTLDGLVDLYSKPKRGPFQPPPAVDEPHANMPPVDGALFACILDQDLSPTTLDGTLVWVYGMRGYSRETVDSMNHYRERGVRMLLANLWGLAYGC